jgi:chorismate synthase
MNLRLLTAGESHGPAMTAILEGMPAGLPLDAAVIDHDLARRQRGLGSGARMQIERDTVKILSGVLAGQTTGAPIALLVENADHDNWKSKPVTAMTAPRPGHADLTGALKYGFNDLRPVLERASARETTMRVAAGAICKHFLAQFGILVGGFVRAIGGESLENDVQDYPACLSAAEENELRCPDAAAAERMRACMQQAIEEKDTLGGVVEIFALNLPVGLGSYVQGDRRLGARLSGALASVPSVKGVEIGDGFTAAGLRGSQAQDAIRLEAGRLRRARNHAGGIEGGISNGEPLMLRAALKPIASTLAPQPTVDLAAGVETHTTYVRSDSCHVPRAVPVLEAVTAFVLADALLEKLGGDTLAELQVRFAALRKAQLEDLSLDDSDKVWWV